METIVTKKRSGQLEVMYRFCASPRVIKLFLRGYNGLGWTWFVRFISKALYTKERAQRLLADVIEDGLISAFMNTHKPRGFPVVRIADEVMLLGEFEKRIPVVSENTKREIAQALLSELKATLSDGKMLRIDGGAVSCEKDGSLFVSKFAQQQ